MNRSGLHLLLQRIEAGVHPLLQGTEAGVRVPTEVVDALVDAVEAFVDRFEAFVDLVEAFVDLSTRLTSPRKSSSRSSVQLCLIASMLPL